MRLGLFILLGLVLLSELGAQELTKRVYTPDDGLSQLETKGMFVLPDSQVVVVQINGICTYFDGYNFYPTEDNLGLPKGYVGWSIHNEEYSLLGLSKNDGGSYSYVIHNNQNAFQALISNGEESKSFYARDTLFFLNKDTISYYDIRKQDLVYSHMVHPQFSRKLIEDENAWYLEGMYRNDLVNFNNDFYRKNDKGNYEKIAAEALIPDRTDIDAGLRSLNLDPSRLTDYNLAYQFNFYIRNYASRDLSYIHVLPNDEDEIMGVLFDHSTQKPLALVYNDQAQFSPVATNDYSFFTAWHIGLRRTQNYVRYFDPRFGDTPDALHTIVESGEGEVLMGGYGSGFSKWDGSTTKKIPELNNIPLILPGGFTYRKNQVLFFSDDVGNSLKRIKNGKLSEVKPTFKSLNNQSLDRIRPGYFTGYFIDTLKNGNLAFGLARRGLGIAQNWEKDSLEVKLISDAQGMKLINVLHFQQDKEERIWMGRTSMGVSLYDPVADTAYTWLRSPDIPNSYGSISGHTDGRGNLWLGSNQGLKFVENPTRIRSDKDPLFDRTRHIELPNANRSTIYFMTQVDSFLVMGNTTAVSFLNLEAFYRNPGSPLIYQLLFGEDIEGGGAEQNAVLFDSKRQLWFGCQEGALQMDWDNFAFDTTTTTILLRNIKAGSDTLYVDADNSITLPTDNRNCQIKYGPRRNPSLMKNIYFDYFLIAQQGDTLTAVLYDQNGVFSRDNFVPGSYRLEIVAKKHGQIIDRKNLHIEVPMTLSENPWFWGLSGLFLSGGIIGFLVFRNRQKQLLTEKELALTRLQNEKNNMQIQAIISSFNPHFINNSLHWVQSRYNKDESMVKLIGRLSENIAVIFGNTRRGKAYHSIEEELLIVRNYIAIQKIRFRNSFHYEEILPTNKELLRSEILLMHLQIHVENAVEHGLRNRETGTFVKVIIQENEKEILLTVEDDGCGRKFAREIGSKGTQTGTEMVSGLMKIFNANNREKISQRYDDGIFTDKNGHYGTRVLISYPKIINYEL